MNNQTTSTGEKIGIQAAGLALGAASGAVTKHVLKPLPGRGPNLAAQVGSAMGAAAATGAAVTGSLSAGAAILTAKVVAVATIGAPLAIAAGVGYGIYRLFKTK